MDGASRLPSAKQSKVKRKAICQRWRHRDTGQNRKRSKDEDYGKIGQLLQRVISVEAVRLRRQMKMA